MKVELLKTAPLIHTDERSPNSSKYPFDFTAIIKILKCSGSWAREELSSTVLLKNPDKQIVLTAVHAGTEINSFHSNSTISFQIMEGKFLFHSQSRTEILNQGETLTLKEKLKYKLTSLEEAVFLLTIENGS